MKQEKHINHVVKLQSSCGSERVSGGFTESWTATVDRIFCESIAILSQPVNGRVPKEETWTAVINMDRCLTGQHIVLNDLLTI